MKSNANLSAIAEYRKKEAEYKSRLEELEAVSAERDVARKRHELLRKKRLDVFMSAFRYPEGAWEGWRGKR